MTDNMASKKNRGTHTALAIFHETISNAINSKHAVDIVLRDVEKQLAKCGAQASNTKYST